MRGSVKRLISAGVLLSFSLGAAISFLLIFKEKYVDEAADEELFRSSASSSYLSFCALDDKGAVYEYSRPSVENERIWYGLDAISDNLVNAVIAMEDRDFYKHHGINFKRTVYAGINYLYGKISGRGGSFGASTLTQQLVKNISGDNERTLSRKLAEIMRAINLEGRHTKEEILELYLNILPLSSGINGAGLGSLTFFGKEPSGLTVTEAATLAGITNSPVAYDPVKNPASCLEKRNRVLFAMMDSGYITDAEYVRFKEEPLGVKIAERSRSYDWFAETALDDCINDLARARGISRGAASLMLKSGCRIFLTVDGGVQGVLNDYFSNELNLPDECNDGLGISFVVNDSVTGDLVGIIGNAGKKTADRIKNRAKEPLPAASAIKPLSVYAPAIEMGIIEFNSILEDSPQVILDESEGRRYYPRNSDGSYRGRISLRDSVAFSKNTVAVDILEEIGIRNSFYHLKNDYRIDTLIESKTDSGRVLSDLSASPLALGQLTRGIDLRKLTECYTVFPKKGEISPGRSYYGVTDCEGRVLLDNVSVQKQILSGATAEIMCHLLSSVTDYGTARSVSLKNYVDLAGKTGTSSGGYDRLFVGFTPYYTAGISMSYNNREKSISGLSKGHLKIWDEVMLLIHEKNPDFGKDGEIRCFTDSSIDQIPLCTYSGLPINEYCKSFDYAYFPKEKNFSSVCPYCCES